MKNLMVLEQPQTVRRWLAIAFVVVSVAAVTLAVTATAAADPMRLAYGGPVPLWGGPPVLWQQPGQQFRLVDGYWRLRLLNGDLLVAGRTITAQFGGGRITGSGGISRYSAEYSAARSRLTIGRIGVERARGPAGQARQESEYFRALQRAAWYTISIRQLAVYDERGRVLLNFEQGTLLNPPPYDDGRPPRVRRPGEPRPGRGDHGGRS